MKWDFTTIMAAWGAVASTVAIGWLTYWTARFRRTAPPAAPASPVALAMLRSARLGDNEVKLYGFLTDQLHKHQTIIWQLPLALIAANTFAIDKFHSTPLMLLAVSAFDTAFIYVFQRMIFSQRGIIEACRVAERELRKEFPDFVPVFQTKRVPAPFLFLVALWLLVFALFAYSVCSLLHLPCV